MTTSTPVPPSANQGLERAGRAAAASARAELPQPLRSAFDAAVAPPIPLAEIPFQPDGREWQPLPGGELEAPRPGALCHGCRERLRQSVARGVWPERSKTLCFACYRTQLERDRRLKAAAELNTATEARFQTTLPFEPVNRARLHQLRSERQAAREAEQLGLGRFVDRRRRAQINARHALQRLAAGLKARGIQVPEAPARQRVTPAPLPADLRLPDAWLPFVSGRR